MKQNNSSVKDAPAPSPDSLKAKNQIFAQLIAKTLPSEQTLASKSETQRMSLKNCSPDRKSLLSAGMERQRISRLTPTPVHYSIENRSFSPSYSIGKSERFSTGLSTPGPGLYNISKNDEKHPAYSIGKAKRLLLGDQIERKEKTPGPSDYSPEVKIHSPSAYLTGKSFEKQEMSPGPADYQSEKLKIYPKAAEYTIGKATRPNIVRNNYPGPSSYFTQRLKTSSIGSFSRSCRTINYNSDAPGPSYLPPSTLSSKGGVIGIKIKRKNSESPGPGNYSIQYNSPSKSFSFGKSPKHFKDEISNVSPASYSPVTPKSGLEIRFSRSLRNDLFGIKDILSQSGGENRLFTPGPGSYDPKITNSSPRYSIGKSQRESRIETSPGPGDYSPSKTTRKSLNSLPTSNSTHLKTIKFLEYSETKNPPPQVRKNNYSRLQKLNHS